MFARVEVLVGTHRSAIQIPLDAVSRLEESQYVYIVRKERPTRFRWNWEPATKIGWRSCKGLDGSEQLIVSGKDLVQRRQPPCRFNHLTSPELNVMCEMRFHDRPAMITSPITQTPMHLSFHYVADSARTSQPHRHPDAVPGHGDPGRHLRATAAGRSLSTDPSACRLRRRHL